MSSVNPNPLPRPQQPGQANGPANPDPAREEEASQRKLNPIARARKIVNSGGLPLALFLGLFIMGLNHDSVGRLLEWDIERRKSNMNLKEQEEHQKRLDDLLREIRSNKSKATHKKLDKKQSNLKQHLNHLAKRRLFADDTLNNLQEFKPHVQENRMFYDLIIGLYQSLGAEEATLISRMTKKRASLKDYMKWLNSSAVKLINFAKKHKINLKPTQEEFETWNPERQIWHSMLVRGIVKLSKRFRELRSSG